MTAVYRDVIRSRCTHASQSKLLCICGAFILLAASKTLLEATSLPLCQTVVATRSPVIQERYLLAGAVFSDWCYPTSDPLPVNSQSNVKAHVAYSTNGAQQMACSSTPSATRRREPAVRWTGGRVLVKCTTPGRVYMDNFDACSYHQICVASQHVT